MKFMYYPSKCTSLMPSTRTR